MRKRKTSITKKYDLIQQLWLNQKDIMDLAECGSARATEIRKEIEKSIAPKKLPETKTPTNLVIDYLGISVPYLVNVFNCMNQ